MTKTRNLHTLLLSAILGVLGCAPDAENAALEREATSAEGDEALTSGELDEVAAASSFSTGSSCNLSPNWKVNISANLTDATGPDRYHNFFVNYVVVDSPGRLKGIRVTEYLTSRPGPGGENALVTTIGARTQPDGNGRYKQRFDPDHWVWGLQVQVVAPSGATCFVILV